MYLAVLPCNSPSCRIDYEEQISIIFKKYIDFEYACVLNRHAVRYGYNAVKSGDSTRMREIVFFKRPQAFA
jgi:hypothetical protein